MSLLKVALVKLGVTRTTTGAATANQSRTNPLLASAHRPASPARTAGALVALTAMTFATVATAIADQAAPATPISNTVTANYTDSNGVGYLAASNTVTTVVQNSPSVAVNSPAGQTIVASGIVVDSFSITNTGNNNGTYTIPADATVGTGGTLRGYVLPATFVYPNGATTCTAAAPCSLATLNTDIANYQAVAGGTPLVVGVEYAVAATATPGTTIATSLSAQITYAAAATSVNGTTYNVPAVTSAPSSGSETDTIAPNARLDLSKTVTAPTTAGAPIVYTIAANDGGAFGAHDLTSVKTVLGAPAAGILITDKIPKFTNTNTGTNSISLTGAPTVSLNGASPGANAVVYYTADATGATGWSTTYSATAAVVGVFLSGGAGGIELPSAPAGSNGVGSVSTPQVTISLSLTQPTGPGSGNPGAITNIANSEIGGNVNADGTIPVIGPGIPPGTNDGTPAGNNATVTVVANTTPSVTTTAPGGASNPSASQAFGTSGAYVGPLGFPQATGSYPAPPNNGLAAASSALDFTAVGFACANTATTLIVNGQNNTIPNTPGSTPCNVPAGGVSVPFTLQNVSNQSDSFTVSVLPPPGYSVAVYSTVCLAGTTALPLCTPGVQIAAAGPGVAATGTYQTGVPGNLVASQASVSAVAVFTAVNPVAPFVVADATVTVTGSHNTVAAPETDTTHIDLYPGGAVQVQKTGTIVSSGCSGTPVAPGNGICPGGVIQYTIAYKNVAPATLAVGGSGLGTEPAFALNGFMVNGLVLTEDGFAQIDGTTNGWGANSFGAAQPTDTTAGTTFAPVGGYSTGTYPATTPGPGHFTAQIGGSTTFKIQPGTAGTMVFSVTVK